VDEEFETLDLGDPRRDRRAKELLKRLAAKPSESISGACGGWSKTMEANRFLGNREVEWGDMMQPHWKRTAARMKEDAVVLCIADTTEPDFNGQDMEGLGPSSFEAQRGMYLHPTYAVPPDREPLGLLDAWMWAREPLDENRQCSGIKESYGRIIDAHYDHRSQSRDSTQSKPEGSAPLRPAAVPQSQFDRTIFCSAKAISSRRNPL
jgi:Transposase DNA-binding